MHALLVEPDYYTRYPPLGLLKIASRHRERGDSVELVRGCVRPSKKPDRIYVTSLFTWTWKPSWEAIHHYKHLYPDVELSLGGIYASLLPDHAKQSGADHVHIGLFGEAEDVMPAYDLVPQWDGSILFASRGCVRKCGFCSVPKLEGKVSNVKYSIRHLIYPNHTKVIFFDNNILAAPNWREIFDEIVQLGLKVDFNQGLDARCVTDEIAERIVKMKMDVIRLAYDYWGVGPFVERAISLLVKHGGSARRVVVYTLFNYVDDPENFFHRVREILNWGAASYPMRYEPLTTLYKNRYVSPKWDEERLEAVAKARRVLGFGGAFPPYKGLVKKFNAASCFDEAFTLRPLIRDLNRILREPIIEMALDHEMMPRNRKHSARYGREKDWRKALPLMRGR